LKTASAATNGANAVAKNDPEDAEEHAMEEKVTAVDMTLEEVKRILVDLVNLTGRGGGLVGAATVN
jgi:hypothetical protein